MQTQSKEADNIWIKVCDLNICLNGAQNTRRSRDLNIDFNFQKNIMTGIKNSRKKHNMECDQKTLLPEGLAEKFPKVGKKSP